ncbi:hypothetical protein [Endozoicomonas euniceicola]|uniref:Uncharacterized protein n=1 Tax=Endozoicomonas euniceicola TaxID=1234143 RepID=A0ABY6GUL4_9GAMM|nr:hypothetical protein [Endozoicomonas euniceicola]UYM16467.1 hypothetical protein NX720_00595 [Endozoicomonas euniceicola]
MTISKCLRYCFIFFLPLFGILLSNDLKAVEHCFNRTWFKKTGSYYDQNGREHVQAERAGVYGNIVEETGDSDERRLQFRLSPRAGENTDSSHDARHYINTRLSVELIPRPSSNDEHLIQQIRERAGANETQSDPVAVILDALNSPSITADVRTEFLSVVAGRYVANIAGFGNVEVTSVEGVSFFEELVQLLLIIKRLSGLSAEKFTQLVNAVSSVRTNCFLPEAMAFNQFFPLVRLSEIQRDTPQTLSFRAGLLLFRSVTMETGSTGWFSFDLNSDGGLSNTFLRTEDGQDTYVGRWVSVNARPNYLREDLITLVTGAQRPLPAGDEPVPDNPRLPQRHELLHFDSGYQSGY